VFGIWIGFFLLPLQALASLMVWKFTETWEMPPFELVLVEIMI